MTFSQKLRAIELDLMTIVDRMNRDSSFDKASKAQTALEAINDLRTSDNWFDDLDWEWQPTTEEQDSEQFP